MKLTKRRLKEIIKEELEEAGRRRDAYRSRRGADYDYRQRGGGRKPRTSSGVAPAVLAAHVKQAKEELEGKDIDMSDREAVKAALSDGLQNQFHIDQILDQVVEKESNTTKLTQETLSAIIKEMLNERDEEKDDTYDHISDADKEKAMKIATDMSGESFPDIEKAIEAEFGEGSELVDYVHGELNREA